MLCRSWMKRLKRSMAEAILLERMVLPGVFNICTAWPAAYTNAQDGAVYAAVEPVWYLVGGTHEQLVDL